MKRVCILVWRRQTLRLEIAVHSDKSASWIALSRLEGNVPVNHSPSTIDFSAMANAQLTDADMKKLKSSTVLKLAQLPIPTCSDTLLCNTSTGTPHPYVPKQFRRTVLDSLHNLSHPAWYPCYPTPGYSLLCMTRNQLRCP